MLSKKKTSIEESTWILLYECHTGMPYDIVHTVSHKQLTV